MVSEITKNRLEQFYSSEKQAGSHPNAGYEAMRHVRTLLRWGKETTSLAQLMGHSSVRTLQRYVSNTDREHKEAMDRNEQRLMTMLGKTDGAESKPSQKLPPKLPPKKLGKRKNLEELAQHTGIQPFRLVGDIGLEPTTPTMSKPFN